MTGQSLSWHLCKVFLHTCTSPSPTLVSTYTPCLLDDVVNLYTCPPHIDCDAFDRDGDHAESIMIGMNVVLFTFNIDVEEVGHG